MPDDQFRVRMLRSGGMAGLTLESAADSSELAPEDQAELAEILDRAELSAPAAQPRGADRFQYDFEVERGGRVQHATAYDGSMPPGLKTLADWLTARARSRPR